MHLTYAKMLAIVMLAIVMREKYERERFWKNSSQCREILL